MQSSSFSSSEEGYAGVMLPAVISTDKRRLENFYHYWHTFISSIALTKCPPLQFLFQGGDFKVLPAMISSPSRNGFCQERVCAHWNQLEDKVEVDAAKASLPIQWPVHGRGRLLQNRFSYISMAAFLVGKRVEQKRYLEQRGAGKIKAPRHRGEQLLALQPLAFLSGRRIYSNEKKTLKFYHHS